MKLRIFLVTAIAIFVASLTLAYRELKDAGDTTSTEKAKSSSPSNSSSTIVKDTPKEPAKEKTAPEIPEKNQRILTDSELLIDNKKILDLKYPDLIKIWGRPAETKKIAVNLPGTEGKYILYILKYDSIDIEMFPVKEGITVENTESFRFDSTGFKYGFYGVTIGMNKEEYLKNKVDQKTYAIREIQNAPEQYGILLNRMKAKNYYNYYDDAAYEEVILGDKKPYGIVVLFKNGKIARIVYGNPNAG